jgi:hypothetical protein
MERPFTSTELRIAARQAITLARAAASSDMEKSLLAAAEKLMAEADVQDHPGSPEPTPAEMDTNPFKGE